MEGLDSRRGDHDLAFRVELDTVEAPVLTGDLAPKRRQAGILRVERIALAQGTNGCVDDEPRCREVGLAEVQPEDAVHRHRDLSELADPRVRDLCQRCRVRCRGDFVRSQLASRKLSHADTYLSVARRTVGKPATCGRAEPGPHRVTLRVEWRQEATEPASSRTSCARP